MLFTAPDALANADISENWTILRNNGRFATGGWQKSPEEIQAFGTSSPAGPREIDMIPEADRVSAIRVFRTTRPMFVTSADLSITSDTIVWKGQKFRVFRVFEYPQRGWWGAVATRMEGA
jgi:hypothetical protein